MSSVATRFTVQQSLGVAIVLVIAGICSVQLGAGVAKTLFDEISPTGMVWLRLASSTLLLLALVRPRLRGRSREDWLVAISFGVALGTMNWSIYQSFSRIPIGIAVTIEFIGPLAVAVFGSRRRGDLLWVGLAGLGVALLGVERADLDPVGVGYALLAGAAWAGYILFSARTGSRWEGLDGLSVASLVALLMLSPGLLATDTAGLLDPRILLIGAAVGLLSSVVPYSFELIALRRLAPATFGILMSIEPAAAALAGLLVVGEQLAIVQWAAIACVVLASAGATHAAARPALSEPHPD